MEIISIPGNLLLLGEYAVLEEGGLGITLAVDTRIEILITEAPELSLKGRQGSHEVQWSESGFSSGDVKIFTDILEYYRKWCSTQPIAYPLPKAALEIDTSPFYKEDRKKGFGSSAALTAGFITALLSGHALPANVLFQLAVRAYRYFQGGAGSGYDIAASMFGGTGLFRGGEIPSFTPVALPWLPLLYIIQNTQPVVTRQTIKQYSKWKTAHPAKAADFLIQSNRNVTDLVKAADLAEAVAVLSRARRQGLWIGEEIGVPANWEDYEEILNRHTAFYKSAGAGNELGICFLDTPTVPPEMKPLHFEPISIAKEGILCSWKE